MNRGRRNERRRFIEREERGEKEIREWGLWEESAL